MSRADSSKRRQALEGLERGFIKVKDLVRFAEGGDRASRPLPLELVLRSAEPGRWRSLLERIRAANPDVTGQMTLGEIVDPRCGQRRVAALACVLEQPPTPWPGFPWTPAPPEWLGSPG